MILEFGKARGVLSPRDLELIAVVTRGKVPSELQSAHLAGIMNRLSEAGFDFS